MSISDAAVQSLPWGDRVADDIDYCIQEWQSALTDAILSIPGPDDDHSEAYWVVTFIGNILWGATVFFPPAAGVAAGVSAATKAVTMVSAVAASGVAQKVLASAPPTLSSPDGKQFLTRTVDQQATIFKKNYHEAQWEWIKKTLVNHMVSMFAIKYDKPYLGKDDPLNDKNLIKYFNGNDEYQGPDERRKTVWEEFVFPDYRLPYEKGRGGLADFLTRQFQAATKEFDRQWKQYQSKYYRPAVYPPLPEPKYEPFVFNPGPLGLPASITCAYQMYGKSPLVSAACHA
jgi:hypothetical protein